MFRNNYLCLYAKYFAFKGKLASCAPALFGTQKSVRWERPATDAGIVLDNKLRPRSMWVSDDSCASCGGMVPDSIF